MVSRQNQICRAGRTRRSRALSLLELLVTIAILLLLALAMGGRSRVNHQARVLQTTTTIGQQFLGGPSVASDLDDIIRFAGPAA